MSLSNRSVWCAFCAFLACGCGAKVLLESSGSGGSGSAHQESDCYLNKDPGSCEAAITAYAFNSALGLCEPFVYGGCQGNTNRFATAKECYAVCAGHGSHDYASCGSSADCMLLGASYCCPNCASTSASDWVAVNSPSAADWYQSVCGGTPGCSPCLAASADPFWASCEAGHCAVGNPKDSPLYACTQNSDCVLRNDLNCCESCTSSDPPIAVNASRAAFPNLCYPYAAIPSACDNCGSTHYGYMASCINSRCTLVQLTY